MTTNATLPELVAQFHLIDRLDRMDWMTQTPTLTALGAAVFLDEEVPLWYVWGAAQRHTHTVEGGLVKPLVMCAQTWDILFGHGPALARLLEDGKTMMGMCYIPVDAEFREAAEKYHERAADGVVPVADGITVLEQRAQRLLESAIGETAPKSHANRQALIREAQDIEILNSKLRRRLGKVEVTVNLARDAAATR